MENDYQRISNETPKEEKKEIPNDKLAKLMYYLSCVFQIIDYQIEERYYYYPNFYILTKGERETIKKLANMFRPEIMKNLSLFLFNSDLIPPEQEIEFYEINDKRLEGINIMEVVTIDNSNLKVLKVMACKESWINKYYDQPQQEYEEEQHREPIRRSVALIESSESSKKCCNLKFNCSCDSPVCNPYCCCDLCHCDCYDCRNRGCSRHCCGQIVLIIVGIIVCGIVVTGCISHFVTPFIK